MSVPLLCSYNDSFIYFNGWKDTPSNLASSSQLKKIGLKPGQDEYNYFILFDDGEVGLFDINKATPREPLNSGKALPLTERNLFSSLKVITESIDKRHEAIDKLLEIREDKYRNVAEIQLNICMRLEELKAKFIEAHGVNFFCKKCAEEIKFNDAVATLESYLNA